MTIFPWFFDGEKGKSDIFEKSESLHMYFSDAGTGGARRATGPPNIWQIS